MGLNLNFGDHVSCLSPVGREINHLVKNKTLHPVEHSEWSAPSVSIPNKDGTIQICGHFNVTVNPNLDVDQHPLP